MAALQKLRSKSAILLIFVGLALFAFIAEEFVRSLNSSKNESHQRVGEVYGESINIQEFNALVEEFSDVIKFTNNIEQLSDVQRQAISDQVWESYVQNKIIEHECEALGLTVTDAEVQEIITNGQSPLLQQTPFTNQQTGAFDKAALDQFLTSYKAMQEQAGQSPEVLAYYTQIYHYWLFLEKTIREQTLANKYQALLTRTIITNPTSMEQAFQGTRTTKDLLVAALPYTSVKLDEGAVTDKDLKAKYAQLKDFFKQDEDLRDIKYIDVALSASQADREQLDAEMHEYAEQLQQEGADYATIVRKSGSNVTFSAIPVGASQLPRDIAAQLDSVGVGQQAGPFYTTADTTQNIVRLLAKYNLPDSVQVRQIGVTGADEAAAQKSADSIMTALKGGEPFDSIAKRYGQTGAADWIDFKQVRADRLNDANLQFVQHVLNQAAGTTQQLNLGGNIVIVNVLDRKAFTDKYDLAVIKRHLDFSGATYDKAYNDFSAFVAGNQTIEDMEANALAAGYNVSVLENVSANAHTVAGLSGTNTVLRWMYNDDTRVGDISEIYTCGNNDHLLCVAVTAQHNDAYRSLDDANVKAYVQSEVERDLKAAQLQQAMAAATTIADVMKTEGAVQDTIKGVAFDTPTFVSATGASEPALAGAAAGKSKGDFVQGIKGNMGVYAFQVLDEQQAPAMSDTDKKTMKSQASSATLRGLFNMRGYNDSPYFLRELRSAAEVKDNRYLFF